MRKHTAEELAEFERNLSDRRMPGYSRRKRQARAEAFAALVRASKKKRRNPRTTAEK